MNDLDPYLSSRVPASEIANRCARLQSHIQKQEADGLLLVDPLNMYYYTGTMQQGVVMIPAKGEPVFLVRRSLERAKLESPLSRIVPLQGWSQLQPALADHGIKTRVLGVAEALLPVTIYKTITKAFPGTIILDFSQPLALVRSLKSDYEVGLIRKAGLLHEQVYNAIPAMIDEGMTEWELGAAIHREMMALGYTGIARFAGSGMELFLGIVSFGESGNYPTASIGPGGLTGLSPAFPLVGGRKKLARGEPIFIDTGFGLDGYFTDKTRVFSLGALPAPALEAHAICLEIQEAIRCRLKPGAIPSQIYEEVLRDFVQARQFGQHFMGFGSNHVPFLGHGIGLAIDEIPVITAKVHTPLEADMIIAVEPKKGLEGIGLVGVENTFRVTAQGGECLTPGSDQITRV